MSNAQADLAESIDAAVRDQNLLESGEIVVTWVVVAATRSADDGGSLLIMTSDGAMPNWQAKGLLLGALDLTRGESQ